MDNKYRFTFKVVNENQEVHLYVNEISDIIGYPEDACFFIQDSFPDLISVRLDLDTDRIVSIPRAVINDADERMSKLLRKVDQFMIDNNIIGFVLEDNDQNQLLCYPKGFIK